MEPVDEGSDAAKILAQVRGRHCHHSRHLHLTPSAPMLAQFDDDDDEASREERAFRMWINSLGLERHLVHLFDEVTLTLTIRSP